MNKTDLLFQMMEQPQRYTADEWQEVLADDECRELYSLMSKTQSAVDAVRAGDKITEEMIEDEWQRLRNEKIEVKSEKYSFLKIAAMFVGILMLSGIAYAAIYIVRHAANVGGDSKSQTEETRITDSYQQMVMNDTVAIPLPKLYDNIPLGDIFKDLSDYYHVKVVYQNEDAPRLRLFYQWRPEYTLEKVMEMLNNFDWIQIQKENDTLYIRTTAIPATDC